MKPGARPGAPRPDGDRGGVAAAGATSGAPSELPVDLLSSGRHTLAAFPDGGVLLDEETGGLFELNPSGLMIWQGLLRHGSAERAAEALVERYGISPANADRDVAAATAAVATPAPPAASPAGLPLRFSPADDGSYLLVRGGAPLLRLDLQAQQVRALGQLPEGVDLEAAFRAVAAKCLAVDRVVLHASAIRRSDQLIAFAGASGAGKTTTARTIAAAGGRSIGPATCQLVCEDLLVLADFDRAAPPAGIAPDREGVAVYADAEPAVRRWAAAAATSLRQAPTQPLSCADLRAGLGEADHQLARIVFLSADRRAGRQIAEQRLTTSATAALVAQNSFLSGFDPQSWRQHLENAALVAWLVPAYQGTVPRGLDALAEGARRYISNSTS